MLLGDKRWVVGMAIASLFMTVSCSVDDEGSNQSNLDFDPLKSNQAGLRAAKSAEVEVISAGQDFTCTPIRVWDGDGPIWCAEGPRIRLSGIAAREMDGTCRSNQPCPDASAEEARDALVRLVGRATGRSGQGHVFVEGPTMTCTSLGNGVGSRTAAWCVSPIGGDLSCAMITGGWALRWERYWGDHRCD